MAALAGRLSAETIRALGDELSGPVGRLMGIPLPGDSPNVEKIRAQMGQAKGRTMLLETGDWGVTDGGIVDLQTKRYGPEPSDNSVELAQLASSEIYSALGFNPALMVAGDAASLREAWRLALFGVIAPLGKMVARELSLKLGPVGLDWQELRASDLSGRARAFQSLVGGGMAVDAAAAQAGVLSPDRE